MMMNFGKSSSSPSGSSNLTTVMFLNISGIILNVNSLYLLSPDSGLSHLFATVRQVGVEGSGVLEGISSICM